MTEPTSVDPGLCVDCRHVRWIRTERGSAFVLCRRAGVDPAYPRYPRLPVRACPGYECADDEKKG